MIRMMLNSVEYDLRFYREGLGLLEKYLLSADVYWPAPASAPEGEPPYQSLTLGSLVLARKRLDPRTLSLPQQSEVTRLDLERDSLLFHWQTAVEKKAVQEIRARINQWRNFISDYREYPGAHADRLSTEARSRSMIDLLLDLLPPNELERNLKDTAVGLDAGLRSRWIPGPFIWSDEIQPAFPEHPFWYLYGTLTEGDLSDG